MRITLLLLAFAAFACAQPGEYVRGTLQVDTVYHTEYSSLPTPTVSGFMLNMNGYAFWYNGSSWDTLNTSGGGASYIIGDGLTLTGTTIDMGVPITITLSSTNNVTTTSHTHALDLTGYTGASTITTVGTIGTGTWEGTDIANDYIADALSGKTYNGVTLSTAGSATVFLNGQGNYTTIGGTFYWQRSGTRLSPISTGDSINLDGGRLSWGDGDTYWYEPSANNLRAIADGSAILNLASTGSSLYTDLNPVGTVDLGSSGAYYANAFITDVNVGNSSHTIGISGNDMTFADQNNPGGFTLGELSAGSDSSWILITVSDTIKFDGDNFITESGDTLYLTLNANSSWRFVDDNFFSSSTSGPFVENANASATNPVFSFSDDTNTGIGNAGADSLSIITNGTEAANFNANSIYFRKMDNSSATDVLFYNPTTKEVTYALAPAGGAGGGDGDVHVSGTPAQYELAFWLNDTTIQADSDLTWESLVFDVNGVIDIAGEGSGGLTDYDGLFGDTDGSPTYGILRLGAATYGRTSYTSGNLDLDGSVVLWNTIAPSTGNIEFAFAGTGSDIRFAIPKSSENFGLYNPYSMMLAGPAVVDDSVVDIRYWANLARTEADTNKVDFDVSATGPDLFVEDDVQLGGRLYADTIEASAESEVVVNDPLDVVGNVTVSGTVDGVDIAARDHDAVTLAGSYDYLSLAGQVITREQIDMTTDITGAAPDANVADNITISTVNATTESAFEAALELQSMQGAVIDAQVPNNITIDLAATVTTNANSTGEVTSVGNVTTIADDIIEAVNLESTNSPTDNFVWSYDAASGGGTWVTNAGGGSDLGDTISILWSFMEDSTEIDTVAHMLMDTLIAPGRIGMENPGDTASMLANAIILEFPTVQDSIVFDSVYAFCTGTSGDITVRGYYQDSPGGSKTYTHAAINPTTGSPAGTGTFTTTALPPGKIVGAIITAVTTKPTKISYWLYYHEKRAY